MFQNIANNFRESYEELVKRVSWPTWQELQAHTVVVLVATVIISLIVWVLDQSFGFALDTLFY